MKTRYSNDAINIAFKAKKEHILRELAKPGDEYADLSPKGEVDEEIRDLVQEINAYDGLVTTSSCAGRVSVFVEGSAKSEESIHDASNGIDDHSVAASRAPGRWLFTSHSPINATTLSISSLFGLVMGSGTPGASSNRLIQFKFEPLIIHILTDSIQSAQKVLAAAQQAGFRESGATNVVSSKSSTCPMVAVRTNGLAFSSVIGALVRKDSLETCEALVSENYLDMLVKVANKRFVANTQRKEKLRALIKENFVPKIANSWEDEETRRARKREEGLRRRAEVKGTTESPPVDDETSLVITLD